VSLSPIPHLHLTPLIPPAQSADGVTLSGGDVTASEPEDCSAVAETKQGCGSGGLVRVLGGTLQTRNNATFAFGKASKQGGAVYVGSGGLFFMEGPTKFQDNVVTETPVASSGSDDLSAIERTWLDAAVKASTGGVEMFDMQAGTGDLMDKFPGQLHVASDGKIKVSRPKLQ